MSLEFCKIHKCWYDIEDYCPECELDGVYYRNKLHKKPISKFKYEGESDDYKGRKKKKKHQKKNEKTNSYPGYAW